MNAVKTDLAEAVLIDCPLHGQLSAIIENGQCPVCEEGRIKEYQQKIKEYEEYQSLREWQKRRDEACIPPRFAKSTFATYESKTEGETKALQFAKKYVADFYAQKRGRGAIFSGLPGTGKTHLAIAIAFEVLKIKGVKVRYSTVADMLLKIRSSYDSDSSLSEMDAIKIFTRPDLLILDEVGVHARTDHALGLLFQVLNERYAQCKPTLFVTNLDIKGCPAYLGERVIDRLREDGGEVVVFNWPSHRPTLGQNLKGVGVPISSTEIVVDDSRSM